MIIEIILSGYRAKLRTTWNTSALRNGNRSLTECSCSSTGWTISPGSIRSRQSSSTRSQNWLFFYMPFHQLVSQGRFYMYVHCELHEIWYASDNDTRLTVSELSEWHTKSGVNETSINTAHAWLRLPFSHLELIVERVSISTIVFRAENDPSPYSMIQPS